MKKRIITGLAVSAVAAMMLTGCGKTPTLEEIRDNLDVSGITSANIELSIDMGADGKISNPSDNMEMVLDILSDELDIDLTSKQNVKFTGTMTADMTRSGDVSHSEGEAKIKVSTSIDALEEALAESGIDDKMNFETYTDYDEEISYTLKDGDTWVYSDYEDDDSDFSPEDIIDFCLDINDNLDEDDQIKVEPKDKEYVVAFEMTIDNDYIENLSKDEKKSLQGILDTADMDLDVDDLVDFFEEYGEYADISIPVSFEIVFGTQGKGKNMVYVIDSLSFSIEGNATIDLDEDTVEELLEEQGMGGNDMTCEVSANINIGLSCSMTIGYDEQDEIKIPKSVKNDAIDEEDYF